MGRWPHRLGNSPNADELPGVSGGVLSEVQGGKFGAGFLASAFSSVGDSFLPDMKYGNVVKAAVIGGTASEIGGGEFANGAVTGSFTYLFNQALSTPGRRYETFSLNGDNGSCLILFDSNEMGGMYCTQSQDLFQAGNNDYVRDENISNMTIDLAGVSANHATAYITTKLGDRNFDNIVFSYHGGEDGGVQPGYEHVRELFSSNSPIHDVLKLHLNDSNGSIVFACCYGVASNRSGDNQKIANIYNRNVLRPSFGKLILTPNILWPTLIVFGKPDTFTKNNAYWFSASPARQ